MSPRAAWRLEAAEFGPMYDYAAGKMDWLAAGLPFEGTARLAGTFTRRGVATADERTPAAEALRMLCAQGFGPVLVVNQAGVVMGAAHKADLQAAGPVRGRPPATGRVAGPRDGPRAVRFAK